MPFYDIAGLRVEIKNNKGRTLRQARAYLAESQDASLPADIVIDVMPERVEAAKDEHPELNSDDWEYMLTGSDFYGALLGYDGILLHSSCVVVDGVAYAFSADSGTGKSTHTKLWLDRFGNSAYILNDDKPALRNIGGTIYACGTPWSGKHDCSKPAIVPLGGICFLERSDTNHIQKADTKKAVYNIFAQTVRNLGPNAMNKLFDVLESIFAKVPLWELGCNISQEAVDVAYQAMKRSADEFE